MINIFGSMLELFSVFMKMRVSVYCVCVCVCVCSFFGSMVAM